MSAGGRDNAPAHLNHGFQRLASSSDNSREASSAPDITERRQSEERLREREEALHRSEARYRAIVEGQAEMVCRFRPDGELLFVNGAYARARGTTPEALEGVNFWEFVGEDDRPAVRALLAQLTPGSPEIRIENRFETADGPRWTLWTNRALSFDEHGHPVELQSAGIDITDRKRAELALIESEARFRTFADSAPAMLWVTDPTGACTFLSRVWYEFTGQRAESGLEFGWTEAVHPEDRATAMETFLVAHRIRQPYAAEFRLRRADGSYAWAFDTARTRFSPAGDFLGLIGSVVDITDRRRREQHAAFLGEITQELSRLSETGTIMRLVAERVGRHLEVSGCAFVEVPVAAREMFVIHDWNAPGHHSVAGPHPLAEYFSADALAGLAAGRQLVVNDTVTDPAIVARGAALVKLSIRSLVHTPYLSDGRWKASLTVRDRHPRAWTADEVELLRELAARVWANIERVEAEQRLRASEAELRRASQIKDEFLATLSHELRTPLNAVLGWAHMLRTGTVRGQAAERALESLERNATAQMLLVNDLLDMSRIVSGKLQVRRAVVDLAEVLEAAIETVRPAALGKAVALQNTTATGLSLHVHGDPDRLRQIAWNLLSNAVKFTPGGGQIQVSLGRQGSEADLTVRDSGEGIESGFLPFVFDRFRQGDATTTRRHGGLGLGLAIVRHLVEAHGGTVSAASAGPGLGSAFTVRLPLATEESIARSASPAPPAPPILSGISVLVVDDEPDSRELLKVVLESQGAEVRAVSSAVDVLKVLGVGDRFHILLADIAMPEQDGISLLRAIRATPGPASRMPAIAISAYAGVRERDRALEAGYGWHLTKPFDAATLLSTVASAVGLRPAG